MKVGTIACFLTVGILIASIGCAGRSSGLQDSSYLTEAGIGIQQGPEPRLILKAEPQAGFAPLRVTFQAILQNVPPDKQHQFGCQWEEWNFGDGAVSSERNNCEVDVTSDIATEFWTEHIYDGYGAFAVRFKLGDQILQSNTVLVRVLSRTNMDSAFSTIR